MENKQKFALITGATMSYDYSTTTGPTDTDFFHKADMEEAKIVKEGSKADPATDGYEALMSCEKEITSGFKSKAKPADEGK
ncbi:hypothetical protein [Pontibacter rugosus]|uniref:Uncharacterized protein n=1 Tax=Pontibacter rugosus TaxID=1745966 RepID=A0ABW3SIH7_9BACT